MPTDNDPKKDAGAAGSSAHPEGWPNMPARSADHDSKGAGAEITQEQRDLEKKSPPPQR